MSDQVSGSSSTTASASATGASEGQSSGENQSETKEATEQTAQQTAAEKRKLKVKIADQEREVDEDEVVRGYSKVAAADEQFREAARMAKSAKAFITALQENPEAVLSDPRLPINKRELAQKWLRESIQAELEDPAEKAAREKDEELKRYKDKEQSDKERTEQEKYQKVVEQKRNEIGSILSKAMALSPLSKDPETQASTLREMASYLRSCKQQGWNPSPEEVAQHVAQNKVHTLKRMAESLSVDELINTFGEEFVQKLHKHALSKLHASRQRPAPEVSSDWQSRPTGGKREFIDPTTAVKRAQNR